MFLCNMSETQHVNFPVKQLGNVTVIFSHINSMSWDLVVTDLNSSNCAQNRTSFSAATFTATWHGRQKQSLLKSIISRLHTPVKKWMPFFSFLKSAAWFLSKVMDFLLHNLVPENMFMTSLMLIFVNTGFRIQANSF